MSARGIILPYYANNKKNEVRVIVREYANSVYSEPDVAVPFIH